MGRTINPAFSSVPQNIQDTSVFQECVQKVAALPGSNIDHAGVAQCESKAGYFLADYRWVAQHPRYKELSHFTTKILKIKMQDPEQAVLFGKSALMLLDGGSSLLEACRLARGLEYALAESENRPVREMMLAVNEGKPQAPSETEQSVEKILQDLRTVRLDPLVISAAKPDTQNLLDPFRKSLKNLSRDEVQQLQRNCIQLWAKSLQERNGLSLQEAEAESFMLLGKQGLDGRMGPKTRDLLSTVLEDLSDRGEIDLAGVRDAQELNSLLRRVTVREALEDFVS